MMRSTALILSLSIAATSCGWSPTSFSLRTDSALVQSKNGGPMFAAYYESGSIHGADAGLTKHVTDSTWVTVADCVDHPDIAKWNAQIATLNGIVARSRDDDSTVLIEAIQDIPFRQPLRQAVTRWTQGHPQRAAKLLDHVTALPIGDLAFEGLAQSAAKANAEDNRIATWLTELIDGGRDEAVLALVSHPQVGFHSAHAILLNLDDISSSERLDVFRRVAQRSARQEATLPMLLNSVEELRSEDETTAVLELLDQQPSPALARGALFRLDDRRRADRAAIFQRAATHLISDSADYTALVTALGALPSSDRGNAAVTLLQNAAAPPSLVTRLVEATGELRSSDRATFIETALTGTHGKNAEVRRRCEMALRDTVPSGDRRRLLEQHFPDGR